MSRRLAIPAVKAGWEWLLRQSSPGLGEANRVRSEETARNIHWTTGISVRKHRDYL